MRGYEAGKGGRGAPGMGGGGNSVLLRLRDGAAVGYPTLQADGISCREEDKPSPEQVGITFPQAWGYSIVLMAGCVRLTCWWAPRCLTRRCRRWRTGGAGMWMAGRSVQILDPSCACCSTPACECGTQVGRLSWPSKVPSERVGRGGEGGGRGAELGGGSAGMRNGLSTVTGCHAVKKNNTSGGLALLSLIYLFPCHL